MFTRDGQATLPRTLASILAQRALPSFIVVVDDGSQEPVQSNLARAREITHQSIPVQLVRTDSQTRDLRRAPWLVNLALAKAAQFPETDYMMISGDDCIYPEHYAEVLLARMEDDGSLAVASGDWGAAPRLGRRQPQGSGRFVRMRFMQRLGGRYPHGPGWEAWLLWKALQGGWRTANFGDVRYVHLRPYRRSNVRVWGEGAYMLGYPLYAIALRVLLGLLDRRREGLNGSATIALLAGYLALWLSRARPAPSTGDEALRRFVRWWLARRIMTRLMGS